MPTTMWVVKEKRTEGRGTTGVKYNAINSRDGSITKSVPKFALKPNVTLRKPVTRVPLRPVLRTLILQLQQLPIRRSNHILHTTPTPVISRAQEQPQIGTFFQNALPQQQQLPPVPQQTPYAHYLQQPPNGNFQPNSIDGQSNLVHNKRYVSQSEAGQLDVYPYKQINGNPRPFTRIISKCDATWSM
ncbi:hypothetical protein EVAR_69535_1 [Eumeta japonica]|uniref:Uncharacterized protein n=1 Tax=Eumeta variegata TaxID=151549 RepID=A0A4C1SP02_EUMVA|nr:hypothetical protein EVAR_69535_1 [Eumeta japonica]